MTRKIAVFTGTRAEYGLLYWLMRAIQENNALELQTIVSGAHLLPQFGETWKQITQDGFPVSAKVDMPLSSDSAIDVTTAMGYGLIGCAHALNQLRPDILVVLGDRYEALVAAQAAMMARIPIAHIHGGESTEGAIDEAIRHAITKMSHLHFVAAEPFKKRVMQLGEQPDRVWVVGATGLDHIAALLPLSRPALEEILKIPLNKPLFLVTYHPVTLSGEDGEGAMERLLQALDAFGGTVVITGVNADAGHAPIRRAAEAYVHSRQKRAVIVENLGSLNYLSLMHHADVVIGNSSSGLLEAPAMGIPSVDVGERQKGRLRSPSVIHVEEKKETISNAISLSLSVDSKEIARNKKTPYGEPGAAKKIEKVLASFPLQAILQKRFYIQYS